MRIALRFTLIVVSIFAVSGCRPQQAAPPVAAPVMTHFLVKTVPAGAMARLSTKEGCTTPCRLFRRADQSFSVLIQKEGYKTATRKVEAVVDPGTGEKKLQPNPLSVKLQPAWEKE